MGAFRLWLHEHVFCRLDDPKNHRRIAKLLALAFLAVIVVPAFLRAQVSSLTQAASVLVVIDSPQAGATVSNPVSFAAHTENAVAGSLAFEVNGGGNDVFVSGMVNPNDPSKWSFSGFSGVSGTTYSLVAHAFIQSLAGGLKVDSTTSTFLLQSNGAVSLDALSLSNTSTVHLKATTSGDTFVSARFSGVNATLGASLQDIPGVQTSPSTWEADSPVLQGGMTYSFKAIATTGSGATIASAEQRISVPTPNVPPPLPIVNLQSFALVSVGGTSAHLTASAQNATFIGVNFVIEGPNGFSKTVAATNTSGTTWEATLDLPAGATYTAQARGSTANVAGIGSGLLSLSIPAPAPNPQPVLNATTTPSVPIQTATSTPPAPAPTLELFSPDDQAAVSSPISLGARVQNGIATLVKFRVLDASGSEMIVIANLQSSGDWTGSFDGKPGSYTFSAGALLQSGAAVISPTRMFTIPQLETPPPPTVSPTETAPAAPPEQKIKIAEECLKAGIPADKCAEWFKLKEAERRQEKPETPPIVATTTPAIESASATESTTAAGEAALPGEEEKYSVPPSPVIPAPPADEVKECYLANIPRERCQEWLATKYQNRDCEAVGIITREACRQFLASKGRAATEQDLTGLASIEKLQDMRKAFTDLGGKSVDPQTLPPETKMVMPIEAPKDAKLLIVQAAAAPASNPQLEPAPAMVMIDTSGDGIPDDIKLRIGVDLHKTNVLSPDQIALLAPVEKAIIAKVPLEEPRGDVKAVDPGFTVTNVESVVPPAPPAAPAATSTKPSAAAAPPLRLSGKAAPNSVVTIYVYSFLPVVVTTTTDANGNWTYDFHSKLADGRHEAYVSINDATGKIVKTSSPLAFFVKEAKAASEADFLRGDVNVAQPPQTEQNYFLIGGGLLVLLAIILTVLVIRQARKSAPR